MRISLARTSRSNCYGSCLSPDNPSAADTPAKFVIAMAVTLYALATLSTSITYHIAKGSHATYWRDEN